MARVRRPTAPSTSRRRTRIVSRASTGLPPGAAVPERVVSRYGGEHLSVTSRDVLFDQLELVRGAALVSDLYLHEFGDRPHASSDAGRPPARSRPVAGWHPHRRRAGDTGSPPTRRARRDGAAGRRRCSDAGRLADRGARRARRRRVRHAALVAGWSHHRGGAAISRWRIGHRAAGRHDAARDRVGAGTARRPGHQSRVRPDGTTLYFAASENDAPFQLRAVDLGPGGRTTAPRLVLPVPSGARAPLPLRDGRLVYVGYTPGGYDLFRIDAPSVQAVANEVQPDQPVT